MRRTSTKLLEKGEKSTEKAPRRKSSLLSRKASTAEKGLIVVGADGQPFDPNAPPPEPEPAAVVPVPPNARRSIVMRSAIGQIPSTASELADLVAAQP